MATKGVFRASALVELSIYLSRFCYPAPMRPYGVNPKHKPSAGPRQPKPLDDADPGVQAERERVLAIVADLGRQAAIGNLNHLDQREVLRIVWTRVKAG